MLAFRSGECKGEWGPRVGPRHWDRGARRYPPRFRARHSAILPYDFYVDEIPPTCLCYHSALLHTYQTATSFMRSELSQSMNA